MNNIPFEIKTIKSNDIYEEIFYPVEDRSGYFNNTCDVIVPIYFYRIIGIDSEEEYFNNLFDFDKKMNKLDDKYIKIATEFDSNYSNYVKKKFDEVWDKISFYNRKQADFIMSLLKMGEVFPKTPNNAVYNLMLHSFESMLELLIKNNVDKDLEDLKEIIFINLCFCHRYIFKWFPNIEFRRVNNKILYYGNILDEEIYFLIILANMGCDILFINSYSDCNFEVIDKDNLYSNKIELSKRIQLKPFPISKIKVGTKTVAYEASKDINNMLFTEKGGFYKPWQFSDYMIEKISLKATYEEVYILGKQNAMFRPNFKIDQFTVLIPALFTKICGTHKDTKEYFKEISSLRNERNTLFLEVLPFITPFSEITNRQTNYLSSKYQTIIDNRLKIDVDKLINSDLWKYTHLKLGLQKVLATKISDICYTLSVFKDKKCDTEIRMKILHTLLNIDDKFLNLLQKFDYPKDVPKIIIYNKDAILSFEETVFLVFFNSLGVDIVIYSPSAYNDIENYLELGSYDVHHLEDIRINFSYKEYEDPLLKKVFKFIKTKL